MVDISQKKFSARLACARVRLCACSRVLKMIKENTLGKGDCLAAAQAAGILAAKNTAGMIPLSSLTVSFVDISFSFVRRPEITSVVKNRLCHGRRDGSSLRLCGRGPDGL
jgi:cyclic pyranopterin phosphate synthase